MNQIIVTNLAKIILSGFTGKREMCLIIATSPCAVGPWKKEEISTRPLIFKW